MKTTLWTSGLVLMTLSGCSLHTPQPTPPLPSSATEPPLTPMNGIGKSSEEPYCCVLPQELELQLPEYGPKVNDIERFEQTMAPYIEQNGVDRDHLVDIQTTFEKRYFSVWGYSAPPMKLQEVMWPLRVYKGGYGSNLRPVHPAWFEEVKKQSNFEAYGSIAQKAIALKWMDLRALPTAKPLYKNPSLPGEGYPFDLLQNSSVNYNEPLFLSHLSKDGAWSYVFTNNASGWVPSDGITTLDNTAAENFQKGEKLFVIEDNIALNDAQNRFAAYSRVGMVLPLEKTEGEWYYVRAMDRNNTTKILSFPKHAARLGVSRFNKNDLTTIGTQMLKNTYGWGGMYGERDCSSMIRDMMTPFGIWLPRNSAAQARKGEVISFAGMNDDQKLSLIKEKGIPFETIIYLKGHVVLYIGTYQDSVMILHNIWGIRTIDKVGKKGRHVVGKAVISTLELGSELDEFDPAMKLLSRTESMNIFTKNPVNLTRQNKGASKKKSL